MKNRLPLLSRDGSAVRTSLVLILVLAGALAALYLVRRADRGPDYTLGGPIFDLAPTEIEGLLLTRLGTQIRIDRQASGSWALSGAVSDFIDQGGMTNFLADLTAAYGGPLLPGTEVEDRRYEFNGPESIRLTVFGPEGRRIMLALGTANPVSGHFYASGSGRKACFTVPPGLYERIAALPVSLQTNTLLPEIPAGAVTALNIGRGGRMHRLERFEQRWWLRLADAAALGSRPLLRSYHSQYGDRRREDGQGVWYLASDTALSLLLYEVSEINILAVLPPRDGPMLMDRWDLDDPWRRVVIEGTGVNPDPTAGPADRLELAFGTPQAGDQIPVLRRGNVLLVDPEAINTLDKPLVDLLFDQALTARAITARELSLTREGVEVLRGRRLGQDIERDGRQDWVTEIPEPGVRGLTEKSRAGMSGTFLIDLDRLKYLQVFPPCTDPAVLEDRERVTVSMAFDPDVPDTQLVADTWEFGFLRPERLPPGSSPPVLTGDSRPVALWHPASGKLLQVSDQVLVTARNLATLPQ